MDDLGGNQLFFGNTHIIVFGKLTYFFSCFFFGLPGFGKGKVVFCATENSENVWMSQRLLTSDFNWKDPSRKKGCVSEKISADFLGGEQNKWRFCRLI